jgi:hypothetical protein
MSNVGKLLEDKLYAHQAIQEENKVTMLKIVMHVMDMSTRSESIYG